MKLCRPASNNIAKNWSGDEWQDRQFCAQGERPEQVGRLWADVSSGVDGFGHMTFRAGKKPFVIIGGSEDGGESMAIKSDLTTQDALIRSGRYVRTPYIGQHGWVSADLGRKLDWTELESLIADGYEMVKPKRKLR